MAKYNHGFTDFSAGELSQKLRSRTDINEYVKGAEQVENFVPYPSGGLAKRPGTQFIKEVSTLFGISDDTPGLYPFVFSQSESYLITIKPNEPIATTFRVFDRDGVEATVVYETQLDMPIADFPVGLDAGKFNYAQTGDRVYFCHESGTIPPLILERTSFNTFRFYHFLNFRVGIGANPLSPFIAKGVPYRDANIDSNISMYFNIIAGPAPGWKVDSGGTTVTLTATSAFFDPNHVGSIFRITDNSLAQEGAALVTAYVSSTVVTCRALVGWNANIVGVGNATDNWRESEWSLFRGWPQSVIFYEQRLLLLANLSKPDTFWNSKLGQFDNFMTDRLDQDTASVDTSELDHFGDILNDDPFGVTIASTEVNTIKWVSTDEVLVIGTSGTEYTVNPLDQGYGRFSIEIKPKTSYGGTGVQPFKAGTGIIYISRDGRQVRRFTFFASNGRTDNINLTTLASELVFHNPAGLTATGNQKGISFDKMAWQQSRSTMWLTTSRKSLVGVTVNQSTNTVGFHRHTLGGSLTAVNQAQVLGLVSIPNEDNFYDDVWLLVRRTIGVSTKDFLERISDDFEHDFLVNSSTENTDHPYYLDASIRFTAAEASTVKTFKDTDVSLANDQLTFATPHKYHTGQKVQLSTTSGLPTPLVAATDYFLVVDNFYTFGFATSLANAQAGTLIDLTAFFGGTHTMTPTAVTTLSEIYGMNSFVLENVDILADGIHSENVSVTNNPLPNLGAFVTLPTPATEVILGLPYKSILKSMPLEAGAQFGLSRGNITRVDRATLLLYRSMRGDIGSEDGDLEEIEYDDTTAPFTGDITLSFPQSPDRLGQVILEHDKPYPFSILGMRLRGVAYDG